MPINFISDDERKEFQLLSNTIEAGNYEEAFSLSKSMLEKYPNNKAIYHNQIGAMAYMGTNDYWAAVAHYAKALEFGFDAATCEENIWESAVDAYKFLIDSEVGFAAIMTHDNEFIAANQLVEKYQNLFPDGEYTEEAKELNYIFYLARQLKGLDNYNASALRQNYKDEYPNGRHSNIVDALADIAENN